MAITKKEKISIYQCNTIDHGNTKKKRKNIDILMQHNSFGIGFDSWLLDPGRLGAMLSVVAHFLAVIAD